MELKFILQWTGDGKHWWPKDRGCSVSTSFSRIQLLGQFADDLDVRVITPGGFEINYNDTLDSETGGELDQDVIPFAVLSNEETILIDLAPPGIYQVFVENYDDVEMADAWELFIFHDDVLMAWYNGTTVGDGMRSQTFLYRVVGPTPAPTTAPSSAPSMIPSILPSESPTLRPTVQTVALSPAPTDAPTPTPDTMLNITLEWTGDGMSYLICGLARSVPRVSHTNLTQHLLLSFLQTT